MKVQIVILLFISNLVFGQKKVFIDRNTIKYEVEDSYNRFDDIKNLKNDLEPLKFEFKSNLKIKNSSSSGFTGNDIYFEINQQLEILNVQYLHWSDMIDINNKRSYRVKNVTLTLNKNPFKEIDGLRGNYTLEIQHFQNDSLNRTETFKGKFKSFKGLDKNSNDYQWALRQNKIFNGIINKEDVYLRPDKIAHLKTEFKQITKKINQIRGDTPKRFTAIVVINENGKIEKEPFNLIGDFKYLGHNEKLEIKKVLIDFTEWYPACVNEQAVKSQIPLVIRTE